MADRIDFFSAIPYLAVTGAFVAVGYFAPGTSSLLFGILATAYTIVIFGYPAFWAFNVRKGLAVRLYRNQALGIGLVSIAFGVSIVDSTGAGYSFALLVILYWIDASFLAAKRSDPLLGDTLRWSKLRLVVWPLSIAVLIPSGIYELLTGSYSIPVGDVLGGVFTAVYLLIPAIGVALFALAARRSGDHNLRRNLSWFGLFVLVQFATIVFASVGGGATYFIGFAIGAYFLYKSARALVPLNKLSLVELTSPLSRETSLKPTTSLGHLVMASNGKR